MLFGANVASADSVWYQSYGRVSQSEACAAQVGETPWQASWGTDSSWYPSWEQWANGGNGGWTCGRSITWAKDSSCATGGPCVVGDIGPGGGLVFLISGGLRYEMAPKTWGANETTGITWCSNTSSDITGAVGTAVGTGSANTTAMQSPACATGAGVSARAYAGGGLTDWFLPSKDELNAMCYYSRYLLASPDPTVSCYGSGGTTQNSTFAAGTYGFGSYFYWSSSQANATYAWARNLSNGLQSGGNKTSTLGVRPVRAF